MPAMPLDLSPNCLTSGRLLPPTFAYIHPDTTMHTIVALGATQYALVCLPRAAVRRIHPLHLRPGHLRMLPAEDSFCLGKTKEGNGARLTA